MYFINESDIVIASEGATFFDPHAGVGIVSAPGRSAGCIAPAGRRAALRPHRQRRTDQGQNGHGSGTGQRGGRP